MKTTLAHQRGNVTLLVSLIMLILMTLMAVTSFKLNKGSQQIAGNMQQRTQAIGAAQSAIENVISNINFTTTPGISNTTYASVNGSATNDISIVTTPTCSAIVPIPASALDPANANDAGCILGNSQSFGISGSNNAPSSLCSNALWDISAAATDLSSNAQVSINQGTAVRVVSTTVCP